MSFKHPSNKDLHSLCSAVGPEDGIDPRFVRGSQEDRHVGRKLLQLCRQVSRTLSEVLADCGDESLRDLVVANVSPAAGPGRLLVTLHATSLKDRAVLDERLARASGMLRSEVARAVHRRKAPELIFHVIE
jgi:ribosome-binding factor A